MKKLQINLDSMLCNIKTILRILFKAPTCEIKSQLLTNIIQNLKTSGRNCTRCIEKLKYECDDIKKRIHQVIPITTNRSHVEHVTSTKFGIRYLMEVGFRLMWNNIGFMTKIAEAIILDDGNTSLLSNKMINQSLADTRYVDSTNKRRKIVQLSTQFEEQWYKLILLLSTAELEFESNLNSQIDTLIGQIQIINNKTVMISEQVFVIDMLQSQLKEFYQKLCTLLMMVCVCLDLLDVFPLGEYFESCQYKQETNDDAVNDNSLIKMNRIQTQLMQRMPELKIKYKSIYQQQQMELDRFLNELK